MAKVYVIGGEQYTLAPLVPAVEARLWKTIDGLLRQLPKDKETKLREMTLAEKQSMFDYLDLVGAFALENQCQVLACVLTPINVREKDKNLAIIAEFLYENINFSTKMEVLRDFFLSADAQCLLSTILGSVQKASIVLNLLFGKTLLSGE